MPRPVRRSNIRSCKGQTSVSVPRSPSASGPSRCGHFAWMANTSPALVRKTAILCPLSSKVRPSPLGIWATDPTECSPAMSRASRRNQVSELICRLGSVRLLPRVLRRRDRFIHRGIERVGNSVAVFHNHGTDSLDSHPLNEGIGPLLVLRILAVPLHEAPGQLQHGLVSVDRAQQVTLADMRAGGAADINLPFAALNGHGADILD